MKVKYITRLEKLEQLSPETAAKLEPVAEEFAFRTNDYYNALIDWSDPDDPIKRLVIPVEEEIEQWGELDASHEKLYQPIHGVEHKYKDTALLLCNDVCAAYCRFCFRKRLFQNDNDEVAKDVTGGVDYIRKHPEITNVLLTGGDPLILSTHKLSVIIDNLMGIDHVKNIRIGTKIPAFNPFRITDDATLLEAVARWTTTKQIYIMAHFTHPRELTDKAIESIKVMKAAGAAVVNQTPIIRGVNDSAAVLGELFNKLSFIGIQPYYVFACRPTKGNKTFSVPIEEAYTIFKDATRIKSGLAKTARFILSHVTGKVEVVGLLENFIVFRNHNLVDSDKNGELRFFARNPEACWLDD
ncbi:MAG: KamA family radical SAM protein, partial [Bacteroidota bacterium]